MYMPFFVPTRTVTFFAMTPSLSARERRDHVHDVAFLERSVLPPQQARIILVHEERHVRAQLAAFVAQALGEAWVRACQPVDRLAQVRRVERDLADASREPAEDAVQQHPHMRTTNWVGRFRHRMTRYSALGVAEVLDALNPRLGTELLADGRVYTGTTRYRGLVAFRPAIVNWRTTEADVGSIVDVVRELGARIGAKAAV